MSKETCKHNTLYSFWDGVGHWDETHDQVNNETKSKSRRISLKHSINHFTKTENIIQRTAYTCIYNLWNAQEDKIKRYITWSRIFSAKCSILNILPTTGAKLLCHSMSCFLSNSIPSSTRMADILAAPKHIELMDCNPESLRYSSTPCKDNSDPYSSAICLKFLCHVQSNAVRMEDLKPNFIYLFIFFIVLKYYAVTSHSIICVCLWYSLFSLV